MKGHGKKKQEGKDYLMILGRRKSLRQKKLSKRVGPQEVALNRWPHVTQPLLHNCCYWGNEENEGIQVSVQNTHLCRLGPHSAELVEV